MSKRFTSCKAAFAASVLSFTLAHSAVAEDVRNPLTDEGSWSWLKDQVVGDIVLADGSDLFVFDAPYRADDAAMVPIRIEQTDESQRIETMEMVVDENPAPVVANFTFGEAMHPLEFETRVRVNLYSNVRAVAHTSEGHFMNGRFVKASGGCSAPASRDPEQALAEMGQTRVNFYGDTPLMSGARREAQVMLRHPNYSGLQRNQVTQLFVPAHYISDLEVYQGDDLLFSLTGGISISENPVFRFSFTDNGAGELRVRAIDTQGNIFENRFDVGA